MRKHIVTLVLALGVGILGFAVSGIAVASNNNPPPGQGECSHGNSNKECKDDPQPDRGKDCEEHGNQGGVNEDHCNGETTPTETTPTETTTTETTETTTTETTTTETTTSTETTPTGTTPTGTTPTETTPSQASSEPEKTEETNTTAPAEATESNVTESKAAPGFVGLPPVAESKEKPAAVLDAAASPSKPTRAAQQAPITR